MTLAAGSAAAAPPDPFAGEYRPPVADEVGTAAGQVRVIGAAGVRATGGAQLLGQTTLEIMTLAIAGVRLSSPLSSGSDDPSLVAWKLGPSLHLLPYRRIDVSLFMEAGAALLSPFSGDRQWTPVVSGGLGFDLSLSTYWFVHAEASLDWLRADVGGASDAVWAPGALLGIGFGL